MNLAAGLKKRGHEVFFASGRAPDAVGSKRVHQYAAERGLEVVKGLRLAKQMHVVGNLVDARALRSVLRQEKIDIVHTHLANDHLIAALAIRGLSDPPRVVRTFYDGSQLPWRIRTVYMLSRHTDCAIFCSRPVRDATVARYLLDNGKTAILHGAVDLERFDPARPLPEMRPRFGLKPADYVVGVVARVQRHRRFDILLEAAEKAAAARPDFRLLVIGRGTKLEEIAVRPVLERGLQDVVKFAGYLSGDDYVGCLAALDAKVFLMPGTDGSCRAVREAMAMGVPIIAAKRGMLPEIVEDNITGRVVDDTPDKLAEAFIELGGAELRRKLGAAAADRARRSFDLRALAENVETIYHQLLE